MTVPDVPERNGQDRAETRAPWGSVSNRLRRPSAYGLAPLPAPVEPAFDLADALIAEVAQAEGIRNHITILDGAVVMEQHSVFYASESVQDVLTAFMTLIEELRGVHVLSTSTLRNMDIVVLAVHLKMSVSDIDERLERMVDLRRAGREN